jgi:selenocysteine lyase/cysteine desulfurase
VDSYRELFDVPESVVYLNAAYLAAPLRAVGDAGRAGLLRRRAPWSITAPDFFEDGERLRGLFASLVGCSAECVALAPSVSYGIGVAAANVAVGPGRDVVVLAEQFPSNVYPWTARAAQTGAKVRTVARPVDGAWTPAVLAAVDSGVGVVAVPQCHWTDGTLVDLVAVGARCREVGAALVIDATQSLGANPLDLDAVKPDFVVAAAYKWLLGPYGLAYVYVAPRHHGGVPLEYNWINRDRSEVFAELVDYRDRFAAGARRYDFGERSNPILLPMAIAALEQLQEWSVELVARELGRRTAQIALGAARLGVRAADSHQRTPNIVGLRFEDGLPPGLPERLRAAEIYVSVRGDAIRVAPHLHTTDGDVDRFLEALRGG